MLSEHTHLPISCD